MDSIQVLIFTQFFGSVLLNSLITLLIVILHRESGRMVGVYPELEGEVVWRMEHLMAKWDMLASLRNKARTNTTDLPDVYSGKKRLFPIQVSFHNNF